MSLLSWCFEQLGPANYEMSRLIWLHMTVNAIKWATSQEKGSLDFLWNQYFSVYAWPLSKITSNSLAKASLGVLLMLANSIGSGETAWMYKLTCTSGVHICYNGSFPVGSNYHIYALYFFPATFEGNRIWRRPGQDKTSDQCWTKVSMARCQIFAIF